MNAGLRIVLATALWSAAHASAAMGANGGGLPPFGAGDFRYGIFGRIYSATLYAPAKSRPDRLLDDSLPKVLELEYHRTVSRARIVAAAERKLAEQLDADTYARLEPVLDDWHRGMRDVDPGDRYRMSYTDGTLVLEFNGQRMSTVDNAEFARAYFGIWIADNPISESLRDALLSSG